MGDSLSYLDNLLIRFDTAEIQRLNRWRIFVGYCDKAVRPVERAAEMRQSIPTSNFCRI